MDIQASHWDAASTGYSEIVAPLFGRFMDSYCEPLGLNKDMKVLDLACGPGTATLRICDKVASVDALDYSEKMVALLEQKKPSNVTTHVADGQDLSQFPDASFDVVISLFGLIFFPDRKKALSEIHRVLKPGGKILITSWPPMKESSYMVTLCEAVMATGEMPAPPEGAPEDNGTPNPDDFLNEFKGAGFTAIEKNKRTMVTTVNDVEQFWNENTKGSVPILMMKERLSQEAWAELSKKAIAALSENLEMPAQLEMICWAWTAQK